MSAPENELEKPIDPPDSQGVEEEAMKMDSTGDEAKAIDPPDNQGGGQ